MEKVLVLNGDYTPLNVTSTRRGFNLVYKGKAEIIHSDEDNPLRCEVKNYKRPTIIRLLRYISLPYTVYKKAWLYGLSHNTSVIGVSFNASLCFSCSTISSCKIVFSKTLSRLAFGFNTTQPHNLYLLQTFLHRKRISVLIYHFLYYIQSLD